jgi:type VI secretion system protein ImpJ
VNQPIPITERIQWHEGMLLAPQHFQQSAARLDELVAAQTLLAAPFSWGVRLLETDAGLLPAGIVRVLALEAVMPDGTLVSYAARGPQQASLELNLAPFAAALADTAVDVFLLLPLSRRVHADLNEARFRSVSQALVEDEVSEAVPVDVPRLLPNLSLAGGTQPSARFTCLRLGAVYKDNEILKWAPTLPPLLAVPRSGELWARVAAFAGQLRGKAAFVAKQTAMPSSKTEDRLAYLEQRERLRNLVTALPTLEAVLRTMPLHPYALYLALAGLLGPLSLLRPGSLPLVPPDYDHADPLRCLQPLLDALQDALREVNQEYREFKFEFRYGAFEIGLLPEWVDKQLVLGMRGQPERDLVAWMGGAIVGAQSAYASLREKRVLGAERKHIEVAEDLGVRASSGYTLFSIETSAALTIGGEPLVVSNASESAQAQRPLEMVLFVKA